MKAWIVWAVLPYDEPEKQGVVVYAKTRGEARWSGAVEMGIDEGILDLQVLRAPLADHLAEKRERPGKTLMAELGFQDEIC